MLQKIKNKFTRLYSLFNKGLKYQIDNGSVKTFNKAFKKIKTACISYFYEYPDFRNAIFTKGLDVKRDIQEKYNYSGDLLNFFTDEEKKPANKWHHYIPLYDKHLSKYRGKNIKVLEIGVSAGGSLQMWRRYFGDQAIIFGVDCNQEVVNFISEAKIRIGDQSDEIFLKNVVSEMNGVDVVFDDGSHNLNDIKKSLEILFPLLNDNGTYVIEDLHTTYFRRWEGGMTANFFDIIRLLIDDMHQSYHQKKINIETISKGLSGVHIYDSLIFLDKSKVFKTNYSVIPPYK